MAPNIEFNPSAALASLYADDDEEADTRSWDNTVDIEADQAEWEQKEDIKKDDRDSENKEEPSATRSCHSEIRTYIREKSLRLDNHDEWSIDAKRLERVVSDAGQYSVAEIVGVEVWQLDDDNSLVRPQGGWWNSPSLPPAAAMLGDDPVERTVPGVGLAGTLWSESVGSGSSTMQPGLSKTSMQDLQRMVRRASKASLGSISSPSPHHAQGAKNSWQTSYPPIQWRDMDALLVDPDTAKDARYAKYIESGFGLAAAVPFDSWDYKGIVIFLTKPGANMDELSLIENEVYMVTSAQTIGSVLASTDARRACSLLRHDEKSLVNKEESSEAKDSLPDQKDNEPFHVRAFCENLLRPFRIWLYKCRGGNAQIPPRMALREGLYTLLGVFCGLLVLSTMNELTMDLSDNEYLLLIGPFGALMTLQYGLTAAPASQPRNAILGQAVAGAVSLSFTYIPEEILPTWLRRAVGPAFAITAMVVLGTPHPPAGAHSVIYASGKYNWAFYGLVVLGSVISIIPATLVNNLSSKRQYPTFWGYAPAFLSERFRKENEKEGRFKG